MIKLYSFGPAFGVPDPSPFVMKIDAWMRLSGITFEHISGVGNLRKAPKGKLPYIDDEGTQVADSHLIIDHLRRRYGSPLDDGLTSEQRAIATLIGKSLDEHLYWCLVYSRWMRPDTWPRVKDAFFKVLPFPLRVIIPWFAQRGVRRALHLQGLGRHSDEQILVIATEMLQALSDLLGDRAFLLGERPSTLDATAFAFLCELILSDLHNPFSERARGFENLVHYCERIRDEYYPQWPDNTATVR